MLELRTGIIFKALMKGPCWSFSKTSLPWEWLLSCPSKITLFWPEIEAPVAEALAEAEAPADEVAETETEVPAAEVLVQA